MKRLVVIVVCSILWGCAVSTAITAPNPLKAIQLVKAGEEYLQAGRFDEAEARFNMAEAFARLPEVYEGLGCVALERNLLDRAEHLFKLALEVDPQYGHIYGNLALLEIKRGKLDVAQQYFEKSLKLSPQDYKARANYALFLHTLGRSGSRKLMLETQALHDDEKVGEILKYVLKED